jgi:ubiquinone/menaquinone biosynthesis C-methylase UbiE
VTAAATRDAFDRLAPRYDDICDSAIFARMRRQVHELLRPRLGGGVRVLEVGCGTGIDAAFVARAGAAIVATDPAPGMLSRARDRLAAEGVGSRARFAECGVGEIDAWLRQASPSARFDGIFSNFGALNCVDDLTPLGELSRRWLEPGGWIVLCLINRVCVAEVVAHLLAAEPRTAVRRYSLRKGPLAVPVAGVPVLTTYHRPQDVMAALGHGHRIVRIQGVGVVTPPPHFADRWQRMAVSTRARIERIDGAVAGSWPFTRLGDHFVIEIVKQ